MIRNRVRELRMVRAGELIANPENWRKHPKAQRDAMVGMLGEIGYADALLARETPEGLLLIDGHLRREVTPDQVVPVLVLDVTEAEARTLLAALDPLAGMAEADASALDALMRKVSVDDAALRAMLGDLAEGVAGAPDGEVWDDSIGALPKGEKAPFQQMTFTLSDDQAELVKEAMAAAKGAGPFIETGNENSNGNALARIAESYLHG